MPRAVPTRAIIPLTSWKPLKYKLLSKKFFHAGGRNGPCFNARGTSGIITLRKKDPEATLHEIFENFFRMIIQQSYFTHRTAWCQKSHKMGRGVSLEMFWETTTNLRLKDLYKTVIITCLKITIKQAARNLEDGGNWSVNMIIIPNSRHVILLLDLKCKKDENGST